MVGARCAAARTARTALVVSLALVVGSSATVVWAMAAWRREVHRMSEAINVLEESGQNCWTLTRPERARGDRLEAWDYYKNKVAPPAGYELHAYTQLKSGGERVVYRKVER